MKISLKGRGSITGPRSFTQVLNRIVKPAILEAGKEFVEDLAEKASKDIKGNLSKQVLIKDARGDIGFSPKQMVGIRAYVKNIQAFPVEIEKGSASGVGVEEGSVGPGGVPLAMWMKVIEYGSSVSVARPVYRSAFHEMVARLPSLKREIVERINAKLARKVKENKAIL